MEKNSCPSCGASVPHGASECEYCGSALIYSDEVKEYLLKARKCSSCGSMNSPETIHCHNCSAKLLEPCCNCGTLISINSQHCTKCGAVHFHNSLTDEDLPKIDEAVKLSNMNQFSDASDIFAQLEKSFIDSPEFYSSWIINYLKWAKSMDSDSTMHSFSAAYRQKAREILNTAKTRFPDNSIINDTESKVTAGLYIKSNTKKSGCFIATAVYQNAFCDEIIALRSWRDTKLVQHACGRVFIKVYYKIGPYIARWLQKHDFASLSTKRFLDKFVRMLRNRAG